MASIIDLQRGHHQEPRLARPHDARLLELLQHRLPALEARDDLRVVRVVLAVVALLAEELREDALTLRIRDEPDLLVLGDARLRLGQADRGLEPTELVDEAVLQRTRAR